MNWRILGKTDQGQPIEASEIREPGRDGRRWNVRVSGDSRSFGVSTTGRILDGEAITGTPPLGRPWTDDEIDKGIERAINEARLRLSSTVGSTETVDLEISSWDLYKANGKV